MLKVTNLTSKFKVKKQTLTAVDGISFDIPENHIVGIAGESGSGKSVTALSLLNLLPPNGIIEGSVLWKGKDLTQCTEQDMRKIRGPEIGFIFQNPQAALNPILSIGYQMTETICQHMPVSKTEAQQIAVNLLRRVQIPDPESRFHQYPHQFSGGMCQRIMIAMAASLKPKLIIGDECTSALDVTIQAQIMRLLQELKTDYGLSLLLISHDLGLLGQYCDYLLVMYLGKIVEEGPPEAILSSPKHPYTQALIESIPSVRKRHSAIQPLKGDIPSLWNIPIGCRFHTRCPKEWPLCQEKTPDYHTVDQQKVRCHLYEPPTRMTE